MNALDEILVDVVGALRAGDAACEAACERTRARLMVLLDNPAPRDPAGRPMLGLQQTFENREGLDQMITYFGKREPKTLDSMLLFDALRVIRDLRGWGL